MNAEQAKALRAPFKPAQIGKLPKPTKRDNPRGKCQECGGYHGLPAVHLDYVGHAAITDRLLEVDPSWSWEPMAVGPNGEPLVTNGGLWIKLTVAGVTRPGFGDETNGKGMKEIIGDALRNAAMRFGVGLDLWSKEDLHADEDSSSAGEPKAAATVAQAAQTPAKAKPASPAESTFKNPTEKTTRGLPEGHVLAANVKIGFGKNAEKHVSDLSDKSLGWYATEMEPGTDHARLVKRAAAAYLADKTASVAVEEEVPF